MSGCCYVAGCRTGYHSNCSGGVVHLFSAPKDPEVRNAWLKHIPARLDKPFDFFRHRVCHLHFEDRQLIKESVVEVYGQIIAREPRKSWSLTPDAVPTKFSNSVVPKHFDKVSHTRKPPLTREAGPVPTSNDQPQTISSALPTPTEHCTTTMSNYCFVPGCQSRARKNGEKVRVFQAPKTADRSQWLRNIPKRKDRVFDLSQSKLCEKHFDPSFIVLRGPTTIIINGEVVPLPTKPSYKLTNDAVPTIFPNMPKYFQKKLPIKRTDRSKFSLTLTPPVKRPRVYSATVSATAKNCDTTSATTNNNSNNDNNNSATTSVTAAIDNASNSTSNSINHEWEDADNDDGNEGSTQTTLERIYDEIHQLSTLLPTGWSVPNLVTTTSFVVCQIIQNDNVLSVGKYVEVNEDHTVSVKVNVMDGQPKDISKFIKSNSYENTEDIINIVQKVSSLKTCDGISDFTQVRKMKGGIMHKGKWYSNNCDGVDGGSIKHRCINCRTLLRLLKLKSARLGNKAAETPEQQAEELKSIKQQLYSKNHKIRLLQAKAAEDRIAMKAMERKLKEMNQERLEAQIDDSDLPPEMKKSILAAAKEQLSRNKNWLDVL